MNIENLIQLRQVGQDVLDRRDGSLGFNKWDCGTYACLLGHYGRATNYHLWRGLSDGATLGPVYANAALHFGITARQARALFKGNIIIHREAGSPSPEAYKELQRRMKYLDKLIARAVRALPPNKGWQTDTRPVLATNKLCGAEST